MSSFTAGRLENIPLAFEKIVTLETKCEKTTSWMNDAIQCFFLPQFLYEQFRRYANIFFLTIGLLQQIPGKVYINHYKPMLYQSIIYRVTHFVDNGFRVSPIRKVGRGADLR